MSRPTEGAARGEADDGRADGSVRVDGPRVRSLRKQAGLTQRRLATRAGYSERIVRKLERGGPVRRETLEDVLTALGDAGAATGGGEVDRFLLELPPAELERRAREWCRRAFDERDLSAVDDLIAPDVEARAEGDEYSGREAILARVAALHAAFDPIEMTIDRLTMDGRDVAVQWTASVRQVGEYAGVPATGREAVVSGYSWVRFRGGEMVEMRDHWDAAALRRALAGEDPDARGGRPEPRPGPNADLEALVRAWFDRAYNQRDPTAVDEFIGEDVVLVAEGTTRTGREVVRGRVAALLAAFDPIRLTVERVLRDGDELLAHWSVIKTHSGRFYDVPATGRVVTSRGNSWCRYRDGLVIEVRDHWDVADLLRQLRGEPPRVL